MTANPASRPTAGRPTTRQRLVDAATDLMWRHGIGDVSVDMILEKADALKGSFYHFFPSKSDLLLECLEGVWRRQSERLAATYAEAATPREGLVLHMRLLAQNQIDAKAELGFVPGTFNMSMPTPLLQEDPRIANKMRELMESNRHYMEAAIQQIAAIQVLPRPVDESVRLLSYLINGAVLTARMNNSLEPLEDINAFVDLALSAPTGSDRS